MSTTPSRAPGALPIHERFYTFQGEGLHMGRPAFFIRTMGCPLRCDFCDSAGTWHPNYKPENVLWITPDELVIEARRAFSSVGGAWRVVITGGEPAIHDLGELTKALKTQLPAKVNIETSGTYELKGVFDWITLSPKRVKPPLLANVRAASEFKFIIERPDDVHFFTHMLLERGYSDHMQMIWLHPEWSQRNNPEVLNAITRHVKDGRFPYRAGFQLHKLYQADSRDARSAPLVPLGGDPARAQ